METPSESNNNPLELKELGNSAVKQGKYEEAVLHYTQAIKLDPKNSSLYSNRSFAFLKMQQFYFAMEDAKETIKLNPTWAKGYFRKGEIEFATFHFSDAINSYGQALQFKPDDYDIANAIQRTNGEWKKDIRADDQIPWLGAGIGIVLGVIIVIADFICTNKPTLTHPILMASLTIAIAMLGYGAAKAFRYYVKCQRKSMLEIPIYLGEENKNIEINNSSQNEENEANTEEKVKERSNPKYTKSQARFRYKKGKL